LHESPKAHGTKPAGNRPSGPEQTWGTVKIRVDDSILQCLKWVTRSEAVSNNNMGQIYRVTGPEGKSYVGSTKRTGAVRLQEQKSITSCPLMHAAVQKYGIDKFALEILLEVEDEDLPLYERQMIHECNTMHPAGYNLTDGGEVGKQVHPDVLARIRATVKTGADHHFYQNNGWQGRRQTKETRKKQSASMKAVYTEERRQMVVKRNKDAKTNDLPEGISVKRYQGRVTGVQVQLQSNGLPFKCFAKQSLTFEENLAAAKEYIEAGLAALANDRAPTVPGHKTHDLPTHMSFRMNRGVGTYVVKHPALPERSFGGRETLDEVKKDRALAYLATAPSGSVPVNV